MKKTFLLLAGLIQISAMAVELTQATNQELLNEVSRRMSGGSAGGASASFVCDNWGVLTVDLLAANGKTARYTQNAGDAVKYCQPQVNILSKHKSKIVGVTQVALCDHWGTLSRVAFFDSGEIKKISDTNAGTFDDCFKQAAVINQGKDLR